ncbi:MAG: GAF domain-containing protein [Candidatus Binatia bacterium]
MRRRPACPPTSDGPTHRLGARELARAALEDLGEHTPFDHGRRHVVELESRVARVTAQRGTRETGLPAAVIALDELEWPDCELDAAAVHIEDLSTDASDSPVLRDLLGLGVRSLICETLEADGEVLGAVMICADRPFTFTAADACAVREAAMRLSEAVRRLSRPGGLEPGAVRFGLPN